MAPFKHMEAAKKKACQFILASTGEAGINTGRARVRVECVTCDSVIHRGTTAPIERINNHLRDGSDPYETKGGRILGDHGSWVVHP